MSATGLLSLASFVLVSTITPGGATMLASASGAHFGFRRSLPLMAGVAAGLACMAACSAAGLGSLILALPSLQLVMKLAGSAYLLWLAWRIARSGAPRSSASVARPTSFLGAVWLLWHNPKGWAMTLGAAASFATLAGPLQLVALLATFFALGALLSLSLWCLAGLLLARLLRTELQWRALNTVLGVLLAGSIVPVWFD